MKQAKIISNLYNLRVYDEINLTGGEPMLDIDKTIRIARYFKEGGLTVYCYSAALNWRINELLPFVDGLHYTIHKEAVPQDAHDLHSLQNILERFPGKSYRLYIVAGAEPTLTIKLALWSRIELKPWIAEGDCPLHEDLFIFREEK
jgi:hypothetical protein